MSDINDTNTEELEDELLSGFSDILEEDDFDGDLLDSDEEDPDEIYGGDKLDDEDLF